MPPLLGGSTSATIRRLILVLSLAGMVLALHLWIQKARGFDQGCLGLDTHPAAVTASEGGCAEVGMLPASHLFGVSNAAWGYAYYFGLALLTFGQLVMGRDTARRFHRIGEAATAAAFLYSAYLVHQMGFVAHAWCVLCLGSATLVTVLLGLHVALRRRGESEPVDDGRKLVELGFAAGALFAALGVLAGVLLFVDRLGTRPLDEGSTVKELERAVGQILPVYIDGEKLLAMRACHFDWDAPALPADASATAATPFVGNPDGPAVTVFYDPNCPHCKAYHAMFRRLMEQWQDRARFTIRTRVVWPESTLQAEALQLAAHSGKYFELWQAMFDRQPGPKQSLTVPQIAEMYRTLGLDTTNLETRLAAERLTVLAARDAAKRAQIDDVPAIFIDGRRVWPSNQTADCLGTLLGRVMTHRARAAGEVMQQ